MKFLGFQKNLEILGKTQNLKYFLTVLNWILLHFVLDYLIIAFDVRIHMFDLR